jgi:hypothetical protein
VPTPLVFNSFKEAIAEGTHDLDTHTLMVALSNTAPSLTNSLLADITQIAATGGYAPETAALVSSSQTGGTYSLALDTVTFSASGAAFAPFQYVVLYNDTAASDPLICYYDRGAAYTLPDGQDFVIQPSTWLQNA